MSTLDGFARWNVAFFQRFWVGDWELTFDQPVRFRRRRRSGVPVDQSIAGTNFHQSYFVGQDAPLGLRPGNFSLDFQIWSEEENFAIERMLRLIYRSPQALFLGTWETDVWHIPSAAAGQTVWQTSRNLPYDLVLPTNDASGRGYAPIALIDGVEQTIITSGVPAAGEVLIDGSNESASITTPDLAGAGTYLEFRYPAKMLVGEVDEDDDVPGVNEYNRSLSIDEFLPTRQYAFPLP